MTAEEADSSESQVEPVAGEPDRQTQPVDAEAPPRLPFAVVGIGASAGGLEAVSDFLSAVRPDSGMAYVFIQHLPAKGESMLAEILAKRAPVPVHQVEDEMPVEPNQLYVIRPGCTLTIKEGKLHLGERLAKPMHNRPVDDFFKSLAEEQRERGIAVVLSGMGSNGTAGAQAIKAVGGLCVAQDPESCQFPSMPRHLIDAGYADYILRPRDIPDVLLAFAGHPYAKGGREADADATLRRAQHHVREILAILRTRTRQDFNGYKKPTVLRRIQRRMGLARVTKMGEYAKLLRQSPSEVTSLADDLLIHVTGFFRDPEAWETLRQRVIVPLIASREPDSEVRAWVTACSSGEEAYTLAILLEEEADRTGKRLDIKVFATDMAERSLQNARAGVYPAGIEAEITPERLTRFFEKDDALYRVRQELRERVVFAPQNVLQDPPFSRIDIASCRNLLIYLEPEVQQRVLGLLHFGLREGGALFLGTSETVGGIDDLFEPIDKQARIFRRVGPTRHGQLDFPLPHVLRTARAAVGNGDREGAAAADERPRGRPRLSIAQMTQRTLLEQHTPAAVTVDRDQRILYYHGNTHAYFQQPAGEPSRDLMVLAREGVRGAVRTALHRAAAENAKVTVLDGWLDTGSGKRVRIVVTASPLGGAEKEGGSADYFVVSFERREEAPPATGTANDDSAEMAVELGRVREELQSTIEELQTSNEELKASHEEVVSINEELQSTNEELETSKEEMQSLNEELSTVNAQLRAKMEEHQAASGDLQSLLTSTDIAVLFLDPRLRIRRFTPATKGLLELISSDIGRPLSDLSRKFEDPDLLPDAETVLERLTPIEREVSADGGRWFIRRVTPYRTADNRIDGVVVAFVDITARKNAEAALRASEEQFRRAIEDAPIPVIMQAEDGRVLQISRTWTELTGYGLADMPTADAWLTRTYGPGADAVRAHMHELFKGDRKTLDVEFIICTRDGADRNWSFSASAPGRLQDGRRYMVGMAVDVTERKRAEEALRTSEEKYRALFESMDEAYAVVEVMRDEASGRWNDFLFLDVNRAFVRHTGMADAVGKTATQLVGAPIPRRVELYGRVVETGEPLRVEESEMALGRIYDLNIFRLDGPESRRVAVFFTNITERKRREERQRFLLKLSDALRPLSDPQEIQDAAARVLSEQLRVDRAFYTEIVVEDGVEYFDMDRVHHAPEHPFPRGRHPLHDLGFIRTELAAGRSLGVRDLEDDLRIPEENVRAAYREFGIRAFAGVPLVKDGRLVAVLSAHESRPRDWSAEEIALMEDTAERTWAAVERARAETALRESETRLTAVFNQAAVGLSEIAADGRFLRVNQRLCEVLDRPCDDLLKMTVLDVTHADDRDGTRAAVAAVLESGRRVSVEKRYLRGDGGVVHAITTATRLEAVDGHPPSVLAVTVDLTERRRADERIRESEERLRLVVEGARDFAILMLDPDGRVTTWNTGAERLLGFTEAEAIGQDGSFIFTPEDKAAGEPAKELGQAKATGRAVDERWHVRKDESRFWASGVMTALRSPDGSLRGFVKVLRDETNRKVAEEATRAAKEEAERANRTKDEFLATLGHELRTPLSSILLWSKMLGAGRDAAQTREGLAAIRSSAEAQKALIEDLLDVARITSGKLRLQMNEVDLAAVVKDAVEAILPAAASKDVAVASDLARDVGTVLADPDRLRQVVWNLLTNAVKFTPGGGRVDVGLRRRDGNVELRVVDTGRGIAAEFLPYVFERFRQADSVHTRTQGGLGLGLAIVRQLVELHGGTVSAESEGVGRGATFTIELPLPKLRKSRTTQAGAASAQATAELTGRHVLLVEDDAETRRAMSNLLKAAGMRVTEADSVAAAWSAYQADAPDLILSDIGLPVEDGYSLIRRIRDREAAKGDQPTPAVAVTAFAGDADRERVIAAGFQRRVAKPVDPEALLAVVAAAIAEA